MPKTITHAHLVRSGLTPTEVSHRLQNGSLTRIRRGVYSPGPAHDRLAEHLLKIEAAIRIADPSSVIAYQSAAIIHGLPLPATPLEVTMIRRSTGHADASPALRVRNTRLEDAEITVIDGYRVTSRARTALDLARILPIEWGVAVCDASLRLGLSPVELASGILRCRRLRGLPRARSAVQLADGRAESPAESISRLQFVRHGIPDPILQYEVLSPTGAFIARTDFGWPELKLVGEVDGKWKYGELLKPGENAEDAIMREKHRENLIREAGYWIVRWNWATANNGPALARLVGTAIESQSH